MMDLVSDSYVPYHATDAVEVVAKDDQQTRQYELLAKLQSLVQQLPMYVCFHLTFGI